MGPVTSARFNDGFTCIASGSESGQIIIYNVVTGQGCRPLVKENVQVFFFLVEKDNRLTSNAGKKVLKRIVNLYEKLKGNIKLYHLVYVFNHLTISIR